MATEGGKHVCPQGSVSSSEGPGLVGAVLWVLHAVCPVVSERLLPGVPSALEKNGHQRNRICVAPLKNL